MKKIMIFLSSVILLSLSSFNIVSADHCGEGYGTCDCGDVLITSYNLTDADSITSTPCPYNGLIINASYVNLNCNGHSINGTGFDYGIIIY